jgi:hypothetical protein
MKTLERLDKEGNVMFTKQYPARQAANMLSIYKYYPQSELVMWREQAEAPKRGRKSKEDEAN